MPIDFSDPPTLRFMSDYFEREKIKCLAWFKANQEMIEESSLKPFKYNYRRSDIRRAMILNNMHTLVNQHHTSFGYRRRKVPRDGPILGFSDYKPDQSLEAVPIMKPVEDNVRNLLKFGLPSGGRRKYLKERIRKKPEDRYNFCETSNGVYGWGLKMKLTGEARFGHKYKYHRGVQSRTGPQPDPIYYTEIPPKNLSCINQ